MCSTTLPFITDLLWDGKSRCWLWHYLGCQWRLSRPGCDDQLFPSSGHMDVWVDITAFVYRSVCRLELGDFVPQVTWLLFMRNWTVCVHWIHSSSVSCLFVPPSNVKRSLFIVFLPLALLEGLPSSALIVCTKLSCPVHTFLTSVLHPLVPLLTESLTILQCPVQLPPLQWHLC